MKRDWIESPHLPLKAGDCLLIAGKGHETGQIVGDKILPFDDREEARKALQDREAAHV